MRSVCFKVSNRCYDNKSVIEATTFGGIKVDRPRRKIKLMMKSPYNHECY